MGAVCTPVHADTVAYYRFENTGNGQPPATATLATVMDASGHEFNLIPYQNPPRVWEVAVDPVPATQEHNRRSIRFAGIQNAYAPATCLLNKVAFESFTVEAWVNFDRLDGWQTIIGRDDSAGDGEAPGEHGLFSLSKSDTVNAVGGQDVNALCVVLVTHDGRILSLLSTLQVVANTWYHVAVVGDKEAGTLSLYVEGSKIGSIPGFNGLFVPARDAHWTLGRGQYQGHPKDYLQGYLDEVRFSDTALPPRLFLNRAPSPIPQP